MGSASADGEGSVGFAVVSEGGCWVVIVAVLVRKERERKAKGRLYPLELSLFNPQDHKEQMNAIDACNFLLLKKVGGESLII